MKRVLDILFSVFGLLVSLPLMLAWAIAVKLNSNGPALFRQVRAGREGRDFVLLKFRTMTVKSGTERGVFEPGNAQRVTRVGRLLRATKFDELPQLINVLKGDMSLVGPRPEVRKWVDAYPERWAKVLTVRPGITDPASIVYRDEETILAASADPERTYRDEILPRKLAMYEKYVDEHGFWGDMKILIDTFLVVIRAVKKEQTPIDEKVCRQEGAN